jgi:hypothetical protein
MNPFLKHYLKSSFIVCVAVLLIAAATKAIIINIYGVYTVKKAIPLQKPLEEMDDKALTPYVLKEQSRIESREVLESLGTEAYLQWMLEDVEAEKNSPTRFCSLFITYYTGTPDMVPHVPDECYAGGGNTPLGKKTLTADLSSIGRKDLEFQYIRFSQVSDSLMRGDVQFSVQYFFHANGKYCKDRTETRLLLGSNWFSPYSYFCKVEWKFYGIDSFGVIYPEEDQTLRASSRLLEKLLPVLEDEHWPDWEAAHQKEQVNEDEKQVTQ